MEFVFSGDKERLDKFLVKHLSNLSRSQIQKLIKDGGVLVNEKSVAVHHFLKEKDEIKILNIKYLISNIQYQNTEQKEKKIPTPKLIPEIIFEDDSILIINKPHGLLVHARQERIKEDEPTLVDWLLQKYPQIKKVGDQPSFRPGIVHRLDKEASGVMAIAKTPAAFEHLKKQFHDHLVKKEYLALVYGKLETDCGKIELPVGRAEKGGRMAARAQGEEGKPSITDFEVLERRKNCTLVKVMPKTGRTHQIRVHFFALGHPLVGDPLYQSKKYKEIPSERLMLHAHKLTIKMMNGEEKTFFSAFPLEFKQTP